MQMKTIDGFLLVKEQFTLSSILLNWPHWFKSPSFSTAETTLTTTHITKKLLFPGKQLLPFTNSNKAREANEIFEH